MLLTDENTPILIVGGGASGLTLGYMLAQLGVSSLIIERYPTRLGAPKAHALSPRTLEICRQLSLDVNEIRKLGTRRQDACWVNFITSLSGGPVGRLPYERMDKEVLEATPTMLHNIPQPDYEEFVQDHLKKCDLVEIRKNHSFVALADLGDHVVTTIEDRSANRKYTVKSKYVIACDGAKSPVRKHLSIGTEGEDSLETMMTIHINADLRPVVKDRVGMLHWVMDPEVSGFIIGYDLSGNQVLICNFDSEKHPMEAWNEDVCRKIVNAAIGVDIPYDILSYRPWVISRKVAKQYRQGRVFLAGDAAHSFPPTGGLGLNSGLGDVHNLAYKLAAVQQGWANDALLDSYEYDRRQVALVNSQQSLKNGKQIFGLLKATGTTDPDMTKARQNLYRNISNPETLSNIHKGIEGQREHFDNLGLHIGYIYGDRQIPQNASVYKPACIPGARLPHAWIRILQPEVVDLPPIDLSYVPELSEDELLAKQYSTLDLCSYDSFTLIATSHWEERFNTLQQLLDTVTLKVRLVIEGRQFKVHGVHGQSWIEKMGFDKDQAVLVRPDQHILACFSRDADVPEIINAVSTHLRGCTE